MTSQVPLLAANSGTPAPAAPEHAPQSPGEPGGQDAAQSFSHVLRSQPADTPRHDASAFRERAPSGSPGGYAKGGRGSGNALPDSARRSTGDTRAAPQAPGGQPSPTRSGKGPRGDGPQSGRSASRDQAGQDTPPAPELVDMLKALLAGDARDLPPAAGAAGQAPGTGRGQAGGATSGGDSLSRLLASLEGRGAEPGTASEAPGQAAATPGSFTMAQLLNDLTDGGAGPYQAVRQALAAMEGQGGTGAPPPGSGGPGWNTSLAALQQLIAQPGDSSSQAGIQQTLTAALQNGGAASLAALQQLIAQPGDSSSQAAIQQALTTALQNGSNAAQSGNDVSGLMEQILTQAVPPNGLNSLTRGPGGGGDKGVKGAAGGSATPTFSTVYTNPMTPAQPGVGTPPVTPMPQPFNQQAWDDALGQNVMWMAKNNVKSASLHLNPPQLGPLQLKVSINHDQANVSFVVHHAAVRDAIEGALPRLRDMFGDGGVNLANVNVSDHSASGQHTAGSDQGTGESPSRDGHSRQGGAAAGEGRGPVMARVPLGLVDYFA